MYFTILSFLFPGGHALSKHQFQALQSFTQPWVCAGFCLQFAIWLEQWRYVSIHGGHGRRVNLLYYVCRIKGIKENANEVTYGLVSRQGELLHGQRRGLAGLQGVISVMQGPQLCWPGGR